MSSPSKILFLLCLAFSAGIFVDSFFSLKISLALLFLIGGIFFLSVWGKYSMGAMIGLFFLFLALGMGRYHTAELRATRNNLAFPNDKGQAITFFGKVVEEPDQRNRATRLTVQPAEIPEGRILITTDSFEEHKFGDAIRVTGKLKSPPILDDFDYKSFLQKKQIYSVMYWPEIKTLERERHQNMGDFLYTLILHGKQKFREILHETLPPPQSTVLGAFILGDQNRMSEELKEKLNRTGLRHITAISGQHVIILIPLLMSFFISLGLWRKQAFYLTLFFIIVFIIGTGAQPSAVRAGIMGGMMLLGEYLGRINVSLRALVFAGSLMLAFNPLLLKHDIGFQLSFTAVLGLIFFLSFFQKMFQKVPQGIGIRDITGMTMSAQLTTLPLVLSHFGYFSSVFLVTNVLVLPLIPVLLVAGFLLAGAGLLWEFLGFLLSLPVYFLLTYVLFVVDLFTRLPFAAVGVGNSSPWWLMLYIPIGFFAWKARKSQEFSYGR